MANQPNRLTVSEIKNEALRFFNLEKGIPFTFLVLLRRPYETIQKYLYENRRVINNPLQYLFFSVAIFSLLINFHSGYKNLFASTSADNKAAFLKLEKLVGKDLYIHFQQAQETYLSSMNFVYLLALPIVALLTFWFFKSKYNYAENLAIHCYTYATANWVSIILLSITVFFNISGKFMFLLVLFTYLVISYLLKHIYQLKWVSAFATQLFLLIVFIIVGQIYLYSLFAYFVLTS